MEQKDKLLFEKKQKLVQEHEADLKGEQQRVEDKYNNYLLHSSTAIPRYTIRLSDSRTVVRYHST
jgi:hypothetical protein